MPNFERCVDAGSYSLMCTYGTKARESDGGHGQQVHGCANSRALTTILRDTWSSKQAGVPGIQKGFVVSDCGAVHDANQSLRAGCDLACGAKGRNPFTQTVAALVTAGTLDVATVNRAVHRLLYVRHRLGEFDPASLNPFRDQQTYSTAKLAPGLLQLSKEAARQSLVLLKTDRKLLPLRQTKAPNIAVIGVENSVSAGYNTADSIGSAVKGETTNDPSQLVTTSAALQAAGFSVTSAVGCGCTNGGRHNDCSAACTTYNKAAVQQALAGASVAVVFIGLGGAEGENNDVRSLSLPGNQTTMVNDVLLAGVPVVVVLVTCNPVNITGFASDARVAAIVQAGYAQHTAGGAIADVLMGRHNPSGRLPYTWPHGDGSWAAGAIGNYTMLGTNKTYRYQQPGKAPPLYPFGFGLSFTTFAFTDLVVPPWVAVCSNATISVTVANTGQVDGATVVQLYLAWVAPGQEAPSIQLVNFDKVIYANVTGSASLAVLVCDDVALRCRSLPPA